MALFGRGDVSGEVTQVAQVDLWRLFVLPFFVQLEIRVRSQSEQSEYCRYTRKAMLNAYGEVASGSVEAFCTTVLRAIGDSCPIAK